MARVKERRVSIPSGVKCSLSAGKLEVSGKNGSVQIDVPSSIELEADDSNIEVKSDSTNSESNALAGTLQSLIRNMCQGVTTLWEKRLELQGVGYRAEQGSSKNTLNLILGYSHPIEFAMPEGITFELVSATEVVLRGVDRGLVGQTAAKVRAFRPPEPYKGKGVRYVGEYVRRKVGKKA